MMIRISTTILACLLTIFSFSQTATSIMSGNNIATQLNTGAVFFNNPSIQSPAYEYPAGSGNHLIYATSFWFGGEDANGQLKLSGQMYDLGEDMYPGPLELNTANITPATSTQYDQIWSVAKADIDNHIQNFNNTGYTVPASILNWPAHGNVSNNEDYYLAPFVDVNANQLYDPQNGDYPLIRGDVANYMILNDALNIHTESGGDQLGVECHFMFYQYDDPGNLGNTTFLNLKVINRGTQSFSNFMVGCFMDTDIGDYSDDFMGCDSASNVMFAYNGSNSDADYGMNPPALGVLSLNKDAHAVMNFSGGGGSASIPSIASEYWLNMDGYFHNSTPITYGGSGMSGTTPTKFYYNGNPNNGADWSEYTENNTPSDKRIMMSITPENLGPQDEICYDFAFVVGDGGNHIQNVDSLLVAAAKIQSFYDSQTDFLCENYEETLSNSELESIDFDVFPNPSNGMITVDAIGTYDLEIFDMTGQLMYQATELNGKEMLDLDLKPSNYILRIQQNNLATSHRITIL